MVFAFDVQATEQDHRIGMQVLLFSILKDPRKGVSGRLRAVFYSVVDQALHHPLYALFL